MLAGRVLKKIPLNSPGPVVFIAILSCIITVTYKSMQDLKDKLKTIKLKNYPGENVLSCVNDIQNICDTLHDAGYWDHNLLNEITNCFKNSSCLHFYMFVIEKSNQVDEFTRLLTLTDESDLEDKDKIDYHDLLDQAVLQYERLKGNREWTPAVRTKSQRGSPSVPGAYAAESEEAAPATPGGSSKGRQGRGKGKTPLTTLSHPRRSPVTIATGQGT